jgi:hypothetical protein
MENNNSESSGAPKEAKPDKTEPPAGKAEAKAK